MSTKKSNKTASAQLAAIEFSSDVQPVIVSVGMYKQDGLFHTFTMKTQGDRVVSIDVDDGDMKAIATETLKIRVVKQIIDAADE